MEMHENIKFLREKLGLSQIELALKVGYKDRSSIAKVESGVVDLPQSKIAAFASALGVTPAELIGIDWLTNNNRISLEVRKVTTTPTLTDDESNLLHKYRALDDAGKGRIRNMLNYEYASIPGNTGDSVPRQA